MQTIRRLPLIQALSCRPIFLLWVGEALSAIGDEIYRVALVWLAVGIAGGSAGYLAAAQAGTFLVFGLVGGKWADHWDPRRTMITVDILRAAVVVLPVVWIQFFPVDLWILSFVALSVAALSAFFEPALQSVIPRLAGERGLLQATNGLMGTTPRLARAVGPGLVGFLTGILPTIHFFTLDAISFLFSAWAVGRLHQDLPRVRSHRRVTSLREVLGSALALVRHDRAMQYVLFSKPIASGAWNIALPLGIALLVKDTFASDVRLYGLLLAIYGVGNVTATVVISNIRILRPLRMMGWGFVVLGLGFIGVALIPSVWGKVIASGIAAIGGPMNDLPHFDILQTRYSGQHLARVIRLRMAVEFSGIFLALLSSPFLFRFFPASAVVACCGAVTLAVGVMAFQISPRSELL